ncbi:MAG: glycosyltransferase family 4 protein [bacterium]|nr:glycosyltransferase family 4 protein [bacterium]
MEPKTTLLAINTRWWNAEAHYAFNLGLALRAQGQAVAFLCNPGSPVHQRSLAEGFGQAEGLLLDDHSPRVQLRNYGRLRQEIARLGVRRVVSFKSSGSWIFSWAKNRLGIQHIKLRGEARKPSNNLGNRLLFGPWGADGVLCAGRSLQTWVADLGLGPQKMGTLYYGAPELKDSGQENPLNLPEGKQILCLLGRNQPVKGHQVCLEAFALLDRSDLHLLFLVKDLAEFPEELAAIQGKIESLGLQERVTLAGPMPNLARLLDQVTLGLVPSLGSEVNCRVAVEFFSRSVPVVAFPVGTLPELIGPKNGRLCSDLSAGALAQSITEALVERDSLGLQARQDYLKHYSLEALGQGFMEYMAQWGLE